MKTLAQIALIIRIRVENIIKIIKRNYKSTQMERAALLSAMLLSLCIFPHHAEAMQVEDSALKTTVKIQMDLFLKFAGLTEEQYKKIHYTRNDYQKSDVNYSDISASDSGFRKLPPEKSIFHQIGIGNENNEKWVNDNGEEYVFNPSTNPPKLVTNAANIGTYNYIPESDDDIGHYLLDILPYIHYGNSKSDPTTFEWRLGLSADAVLTASKVDEVGKLVKKVREEGKKVGEAGIKVSKKVGEASIKVGKKVGEAGIKAGKKAVEVGEAGIKVSKMVAQDMVLAHALAKQRMITAMNVITEKLQIDGIPLQVAARAKKIQADMGIENLTGAGSLLRVGNISFDYKTLDDSGLSLDLISDNAQENMYVKDFRFPIDPVNKQQKEEKNAQSFNDDQRIKTVNLAVKQRQEEQRRIKQTIIKKLPTTPEPGAPAGPNPDPSLKWAGSASVVSSSQDSDSIKGWDRRYWGDGTAVGVLIYHTTLLSDNALPKGGSSTQINFDRGLFTFRSIYSNLYMPQSTTATPNYGDYDYVAWGTWDDSSFIHYYENDNFGGHWVYGQIPKPENMPKLGSASYAGQVRGGYVNYKNGIMEANSITGDINMTVNFQDRNLSGTMNLDRNSSSWATATFSTPITGRTGADPPYDEVPIYFNTRLNVYSGGGGYGGGSMFGWFFGKDAAEVGGSFLVDKFRRDCGCGAAGAFRAKKQ